jgi:hypothetical protein
LNVLAPAPFCGGFCPRPESKLNGLAWVLFCGAELVKLILVGDVDVMLEKGLNCVLLLFVLILELGPTVFEVKSMVLNGF